MFIGIRARLLLSSRGRAFAFEKCVFALETFFQEGVFASGKAVLASKKGVFALEGFLYMEGVSALETRIYIDIRRARLRYKRAGLHWGRAFLR